MGFVKIGVRAHDFGRKPAAELAHIIAGYGFNATQLAAQKAISGVESYRSLGEGECAEIARAFAAEGIEIAVLGCYIEPALVDRDERLAQVELFGAGLRAARTIGAKCVGTETTRFEGADGDRQARYALLLDSVLRMAEAAEKEDVDIAIEPVHYHTLNTAELTFRLLREVGSDRVGVIFDPVNLLHPSLVRTQAAFWEECLDAFGGKVRAVHVKDARLGETGYCSCPLGEGVMDYEAVMGGLFRRGIDVPLLREELHPDHAASDRAYLSRLAARL
jgi:sugar phosphate isomerase/epimerase